MMETQVGGGDGDARVGGYGMVGTQELVGRV